MKDKKPLLDRIVALKKELAKARDDCSKAEGALEQILNKLATKFDCNSLAEAKKQLKSLESQRVTLKSDIEDELAKLLEEYPDATQ